VLQGRSPAPTQKQNQRQIIDKTPINRRHRTHAPVALLDLRERVEHAAAALLQDGLLEDRLGLARLDEPVDVLLGDVLPRDGVHAPLDDLAVLVVRPVIDRVLPMRDAGYAHTLVADGAVTGKVILST